MTILQAILLGIIEGLTEFIPVSSTAQLLVGQALLRIPASEAMTAFLVIVQLGPLLALIIYFSKDLWAILVTTLKNIGGLREFKTLPDDARLGWYILLASIPALLVGFLLKDAVEALFKIPLQQAAIRMYTAAGLMTLAEIFGRRSRQLSALTWLDALVVGLFQVLAVFPARRAPAPPSPAVCCAIWTVPPPPASPSCSPYRSCWLPAPTRLLKLLHMPGLDAVLLPYAVGFIVAAVVGWLAIRWLMGYLRQHTLYIFIAFCAVVGTLCLVAQFLA